MVFDSDNLGPSNAFEALDGAPTRPVAAKYPAADRVRRRDDAEQRLAERVAPGAHRAEVAPAWREAAHRMRVHEPDDVAARFLAA
jgi:hypothetical protein